MAPCSPRPPWARSRSGSATVSPPGWTSTHATAASTTTWTPASAPDRPRTRSRSAPVPPSGTSPSTAPSPPTPERPRHDQSNPSVRDRGRRTAQVLRRQGRPRRHRSPGRQGDDLRPAGPQRSRQDHHGADPVHPDRRRRRRDDQDRKSTRLNSSHPSISYAVFCLKKKNKRTTVRKYYKTRTKQ